MMSKIIAFAGLPGTGKTTLAKRLADQLGAVLLNKDEIRAALFSPTDIEYSDRQNDFCMEVIYQLAKYHLSQHPERTVIIDGRTFSRKHQLDALIEAMQSVPHQLYVVHGHCPLEIAEARIMNDHGSHPARDRDAALLRRVAASFEEITVPHLVVDTGNLTPAESLIKVCDFIAGS